MGLFVALQMSTSYRSPNFSPPHQFHTPPLFGAEALRPAGVSTAKFILAQKVPAGCGFTEQIYVGLKSSPDLRFLRPTSFQLKVLLGE